MRRELYAAPADEPNIESLFFANEAAGAVFGRRLPDGALVFLMTVFAPGSGAVMTGGAYFRVTDARIFLNDIRHL